MRDLKLKRFTWIYDALRKCADNLEFAEKLEKRAHRVEKKAQPGPPFANIGGLSLGEVDRIVGALRDMAVIEFMTVFGAGEGQGEIVDNSHEVVERFRRSIIVIAVKEIGWSEQQAERLIVDMRAYRNQWLAHRDANFVKILPREEQSKVRLSMMGHELEFSLTTQYRIPDLAPLTVFSRAVEGAAKTILAGV